MTPPTNPRYDYLWWQTGIVYQIYPRSFQDASGDGVGDLEGVLQRLDYLEWLGIDAVWLSPIYPSPMKDFGYDVADYTGIHPLFGSMDDFDRLLAEVHGRDMKLILDLVPNHSSDEHPWFQESRSSRDNPKRDWYIWRDPAPDGGPPTNWRSVFGGSGWEYDEATGQYYYHAFLKEQPDLNWRNPEVRAAMFDAMRFWLDKGVDGFRVDVIWHMIKDERLRDNPHNPDYREGQEPYRALLPSFSTDQPGILDLVGDMRAVLDEYDERVMIGEIYLPIHRLVAYYGIGGAGAHLPFNFQLITLPWDAREIAAAVSEYEGALPVGGWPNWVLGNHDKSRIATRVGRAQARVAAVLLLTLRGTPTMYYGDEIGMIDVEIPPEEVQDPQQLNQQRAGVPGRDPERTPMQWDATPNAGFSTAKPWLPLAGDYETVNVEVQRDDPDAMLSLYRRLIDLRRAEPALSVGDYVPLPAEEDVLAYVRVHGDRRLLVGLNLGGHEASLPLGHRRGRVLLGTHRDREGDTVSETLHLRGDEAVVVELA